MNFLNKFKKPKTPLSKNIINLYLNRLLVQTAFGLITGFGTLFFYEKFDGSIPKVLLLVAALHLSYGLFTHLGAKLIKKIGMRKMMVFAMVFLSIMFLSRIFWEYSAMISLAAYFIAFTFYKTMYWVPYHIEFAAFTNMKNRGRQTAFLYNIGTFFAALLPFIGGFVLSTYGYNMLFILGFIFVIISILPLLRVEETKENYIWSFRDLIKELFSKDNRSIVNSNIGDGMQSAVGSTIWPIFVFLTIGGDYLKMGFVLAIVPGTIIALQWMIGNWLDRVGREKIMKIGNIVYFTGWIFKMFIESIFGVFVIDVYHKLGSVVNKISFDVSGYDNASNNGHYVDEYTVIQETSHLLGRSFMALLLIPVVIFWGIKFTFLFGALATLLMMLINRRSLVR